MDNKTSDGFSDRSGIIEVLVANLVRQNIVKKAEKLLKPGKWVLIC